mmetsp:Transcript_34337/g.94892  ORF Transcript_34337/g.94892 Transcript_34337/m.94892 type:complete len:250 (-) Transcript_34337:730-1479(-)
MQHLRLRPSVPTAVRCLPLLRETSATPGLAEWSHAWNGQQLLLAITGGLRRVLFVVIGGLLAATSGVWHVRRVVLDLLLEQRLFTEVCPQRVHALDAKLQRARKLVQECMRGDEVAGDVLRVDAEVAAHRCDPTGHCRVSPDLHDVQQDPGLHQGGGNNRRAYLVLHRYCADTTPSGLVLTLCCLFNGGVPVATDPCHGTEVLRVEGQIPLAALTPQQSCQLEVLLERSQLETLDQGRQLRTDLLDVLV